MKRDHRPEADEPPGPAVGGTESRNEPSVPPTFDPDLRAVLDILRVRVGHDFCCYKPGTLFRRVRRRMALRKVASFADYARFLEAHPYEIPLLHKDLLIGVTEFFRQPKAWDALDEKVIRRLVENAETGSEIRVWVPGCSTGKEVYSLAMLLFERVEKSGKPLSIQIFATDPDVEALAVARSGSYSAEELGPSVSPERRKRFFEKGDGRYQVLKEIRKHIIFAPQNLTTDPPFSRVDLIICRNLLIYLDQSVQKKVIALFHFALGEGGFLFLGAAETVGDREDLFKPVSKKWRIYRRVGVGRCVTVEIPVRPSTEPLTMGGKFSGGATANRTSLASAAQQVLVERFAPACVMIDRKFQVLYVHGDVEGYLTFPSGELTTHIVDMAREGLGVRLRGAISKCLEENRPVSGTARVRRGEKSVPVKAVVSPLRYPRDVDGLLLVTFEDVRVQGPDSWRERAGGGDISQLEDKLKVMREELHSTIEQLESANDLLKASNEKVTAANEELQSLNEDLNSVNARLQGKVEELREAHDRAGWLARFPEENPHPVVRVSAEGKVLYGNPASVRLAGWYCNPGGSLPHALQPLLRRALAEGRAIEEEAELGGKPYAVVVTPIPTEGYANIYGQDITERKRAKEALRESEQRVRRKLDSILSPDEDIGSLDLSDIFDGPAIQSLMDDFYHLARIPMSILDLQGNLLVGVGWQEICTRFHRAHPETCAHCIESDTQLTAEVPPGEVKLYKCKNNMWDIATPIMVGGQHVGNLFSGQFLFDDEEPDYDYFRSQARQYGFEEEAYIAALERVPRLSRESVNRGMSFFVKLADTLSKLSYSNIKLARSLAERDGLMDSLRESELRLSRAQEIAHLGSWELDLVRNELTWSDEVYRIFGLEPQEFAATYEAFLEHVHPDDREAVDEAYSGSVREGKDAYEIEHRVTRKDTGETRWVHEKCQHIRDGAGRINRSLGMVLDITERRQAEAALRKSESRYRELVQNANSAIIRWKRDGTISFFNEYAQAFFGYGEGEVIGKHVSLLVPERESTGADLTRLVQDIVDNPERYVQNVNENVCRDGRRVWMSWTNKPILDKDGQVTEILAVGSNVTERKEAEERIKRSLREKEVLLKEIHHRVKNNMQIISSLVSLQADGSEDETVRGLLRDVTDRVRSMALVHEKLYQSSDLARVDFSEYARSLMGYLWRAHGAAASGIGLMLDLEPVSLAVDVAVPCGLLLNELASNALKHAFSGRSGGQVTVLLRGQPTGLVRLGVRDNGVGLPPAMDWRETRSMGLRLVQMLVGQLGGTVDVQGGEGTVFEITFGGRRS